MFDSQSEKVERGTINDERLQTLLKGEKQAPAVRRFLGIDQQGRYPERSEFPASFVLAGEISNKVREITRDTMKDKKHREREVWVGVKGNGYAFSPVHIGTETMITHDHRNLFPDIPWDFALMEVHTHGPKADDQVSRVSPEDLAMLDNFSSLPVMTVSHDGGLWMMVKAGEFYSNPTPFRLEDASGRSEELIEVLRQFEAKNFEEELAFLSTVARGLNYVPYTFISVPRKKSIIDFDNKEISLRRVDIKL